MEKLVATFLAMLLLGYGSQAQAATHPGERYVAALCSQTLTALELPKQDQTATAQSIYDHLVASVWFAPPVGMDSWRWRQGDSEQSLGYLESRAISPLAFGLGSCEDYAAAFVLLARAAGLQANYLPGLTLSVAGEWVDHAWATVQVDGRWYHVDPQLEDNITRNHLLRYRYFLRTDKEMQVDHIWGEALMRQAGISQAQQDEIWAQWRFISDIRPLERPQPRQLHPPVKPSRSLLQDRLAQERAAWEALNGALATLPDTTQPPLFGQAGYGPPD